LTSLNRILSGSSEILATFLLYLMALVVSNMFSAVLDGDLSFILYLPAGIKLLSILVFQWRGAIGIAFAIFARFMFYDPNYTVLQSLLMASINAGVSFLVIYSYLKIFKISSSLGNLNLWHIIGLSAVCSITNALLFSWLLFIFRHLAFEHYWHKVFLIVINNFTGNAVLVWLLTYTARRGYVQAYLRKWIQTPTN